MFRYDILSKKTGVITHAITAEKPPALNKAWGDPSTYDIIVTDISQEAAIEESVKRNQEFLIDTSKEFQDAFFKERNGDSSAMDDLNTRWIKNNQDNPIITKAVITP